MSNQAVQWAFGQRAGAAKITLLALASFADAEGCNCYPSIETLAGITEGGVRSVKRHLRMLEKRGLVTRRRRGPTSAMYTLNMHAVNGTAYEPSTGSGETTMERGANLALQAPEIGANLAPHAQNEGPKWPVMDPERGAKMAPQAIVSENEGPFCPNEVPKWHRIPSEIQEQKGKEDSPPSPASRARRVCDRPGEPSGFAQWWSEYPRKIGRDAAARAYASALKRGATEADLLEGLRRTEWRDEVRYQPHATTWLNGGRWKDEPEPQRGLRLMRSLPRSEANGFAALAIMRDRERAAEAGAGDIIDQIPEGRLCHVG